MSLEKNGGFVKIYRKMINWEWYTDVSVKTLFIHCLLNARHSSTRWRGIELKKGQFPTGISKLSKETGLSFQQVRTALKKLENTEDLTSETTNKGTVITVNNYSIYNDNFSMSNKQANKQSTNNQQTNNKQITTIKESKESKESKEKKDVYLDFVKLTKSEHNKLIEKFGEKGAADKIYNLNEYGHTKAKKFKEYTDHYRVILRWSRNDIETIKKAERKGKLPL